MSSLIVPKHARFLPSPALSLDSVLVLMDDAITFFGRPAAKEQAKLVERGTTRTLAPKGAMPRVRFSG